MSGFSLPVFNTLSVGHYTQLMRLVVFLVQINFVQQETKVGRWTHEILAVVGHRHQKCEQGPKHLRKEHSLLERVSVSEESVAISEAGGVSSWMCEKGLVGSWYNKLHDHLPVGGLCYIASIIQKVYSWYGGGKTCAWSLIAVCMLLQICQDGIGSKLVKESEKWPPRDGAFVNE